MVADVNSGEILALANLPSYDPNQRGSRSGILLRNRSVTDIFEPGSTIKPFTTALALHQGIVKPNTVIDTSPGYLTMGSARISDSHPHDLLTVSEVLAKSSNVGTVKIAMQMPAKALWEMFTQIGLGQQPHLGFPGAAAGRVRSYKTWRPIEQATMSYGYGLSVSLVQMARAYMVFARDGEIIPLTLQKTDAAPIVQRIVEPQHAHAVREMLELATSTSGTGSRAQLSGYRVAGKTGTAHKLVDGRYADKFVASFIGFTPV